MFCCRGRTEGALPKGFSIATKRQLKDSSTCHQWTILLLKSFFISSVHICWYPQVPLELHLPSVNRSSIEIHMLIKVIQIGVPRILPFDDFALFTPSGLCGVGVQFHILSYGGMYECLNYKEVLICLEWFMESFWGADPGWSLIQRLLFHRTERSTGLARPCIGTGVLACAYLSC